MRPASPRAEPAPAVNGASGHAPGTAAVRPPATVAPMTLGTSVSNSRGVPGLVSGKYVWRSTVPNPGEAEGGGGALRPAVVGPAETLRPAAVGPVGVLQPVVARVTVAPRESRQTAVPATPR